MNIGEPDARIVDLIFAETGVTAMQQENASLAEASNQLAVWEMPEVQRAFASVLGVADEVGVGMDEGPRRAKAVVSQLLRRLSGIARAKHERLTDMKLEIAEVERFHQPYLQRLERAYTAVENAVKAMRPHLPYPVDSKGKVKSKTLQFPYGSVGYKESGGALVKQKDVLADALLNRWCVLNKTPELKVFRLVPVGDEELAELRKVLRAELDEDPLAMLPPDLVVEREDATAIKALVKETGEVPDGMEIGERKVTDVVTVDGLASTAVEAVALEMEEEEAEYVEQ